MPLEKRARKLVSKLYNRGAITSKLHIVPAVEAITAELRKVDRETRAEEADVILGT